SVQSDLNAGCREIWLTSQDNAAYGMDEGKRKLPELLKSILELKGNCQEPPVKDRWHDNAPLRVVLEHAQNSTSDSNHSLQTSGILTFKVRLGMMNPDNVLPILNELVKIYRHEKMYKFLHIPLQSGSNRILKLMNRSYTTADFMRIISRFKQEIPDITISTDIIAAYPSETNDDFQETLDALKAIKPDVLNISKFWLRKGTAAAEMPKPEQIDAKTAKQRASGLMKLHLRIALENKKMLVGKKIRCLVNDKGFKIHGRQTWLARGDNYELVAIISDNLSSNIKGKSLLGKFIDVRINEAKPHYLVGEKFQQ
ncbi:radical SAM protein, partial [Candidatus Pacearchaeota archaeon]|nr:radical SAM protein [Candidatus Pacearchaeota archaeon]